MKHPSPRTALMDPRVTQAMSAWDAATLPERATLLERLLHPLGPLARVAVASGAFGLYIAPEHWGQGHVRLEDAASFRADQVLALARFAFEVQPDVLQGQVNAGGGETGGVVGLVGLASAVLVALWRH